MSEEQRRDRKSEAAKQSVAKSAAADSSLIALSISAVLALGLAATILWLIFGTPSTDRPGISDESRRGLSRDEATVIFADDDAAGGEPKAQGPGSEKEQQQRDTRSSPDKKSGLEPADHRTAREPSSQTDKVDQRHENAPQNP